MGFLIGFIVFMVCCVIFGYPIYLFVTIIRDFILDTVAWARTREVSETEQKENHNV